MGEKGRYRKHTAQPVPKQMAGCPLGKYKFSFFLMRGSKYMILVVFLINERKKERKRERKKREREGRRKEERKKREKREKGEK